MNDAKSAVEVREEGKEYVMADGDGVKFRLNVSFPSGMIGR